MNNRKLIECVRAHECLYDQTTLEYRQNKARLTAWKKVAEQMNSTALECKKQWMNLRNAFLHAVSRRKKAGSSISKWRYADEMSFLLPFFTQRPSYRHKSRALYSSSFQNDTNSEDTDGDRASQASSIEDETNPQDYDQDNAHDDDQDNVHDDDQDNAQDNKDTSEAALLIEVIKHFNKEREKDEIDLFFECMAKTVKQFPKLEQIKVERQIFDCVNAVEFKLLNDDPLTRAPNGFGNGDHDDDFK